MTYKLISQGETFIKVTIIIWYKYLHYTFLPPLYCVKLIFKTSEQLSVEILTLEKPTVQYCHMSKEEKKLRIDDRFVDIFIQAILQL